VLGWIDVRWAGKGADGRLDPFKFALSWATGRHPERVPVNYLHGIPRFYEGADRAEIIWEDAEVDLFCRRAPEQHADAVRLARETGLRIGDLVKLERREIRTVPDVGAGGDSSYVNSSFDDMETVWKAYGKRMESVLRQKQSGLKG
jgi:hypothetical protein